MLTTYLFRYTSEYTIKTNFPSGGKGALTPNQNPAEVPERESYLNHVLKQKVHPN